MNETLQLEPDIQLHDGPKLLIEWPPRWQEFTTSIRPAFARSGRRLAGEAPLGIHHYRGMAASFLLQVFLLFVLIVLPREVGRLRPYAAPRLQPDEVIYYSADELPRTQDLGGAQSGAPGRAGGRQAQHRTQTIRITRGASLAQQVLDAPNLKLPSSNSAVANLLAFKAVKPIPGASSAEGLHSTASAPNLPANVIAPPVDIARETSRKGFTLTSIVPPAPNVSSSNSRSAPSLSAAIVPPAPSTPTEHPLYAPRLDSSVIGPAPNISRDRSRSAPALNSSVIAPASTRVSREQARSAPVLNGAIVAPAPTTVDREVAPSRVQMNNVAVVPPPVSAPQRDSSRTAKLNLPAPSVIAPPPSAAARDQHRLESGRLQSASPTVVPPPPTQVANGSFLSSVIGKLFGTQDVVPPPPSVSSTSTAGTSRSSSGGSGNSLSANVVPPPPSFGSANNSFGGSSGRSQDRGASNVVPPPPSVSGNGSSAGSASAGSSLGRSNQSSLGASNVVPPPPLVSSSGASSSGRGAGRGGNGTLLAGNVVPPPPSVGSGSGISGSGKRGSGFGGPGDVGSPLAPAKGSAGSGDHSAVVVSPDPGLTPGLPGSGGKGSLAMSPSGGDKPGLGGSGGGSGIGSGSGSGSGLTGEASGAGKSGSAYGSDPNAHAGISPTPGTGGAGSATTGIPAAPGVDVRGGSTVVNLPSFDSGNSNAPTLPGRSSVKGDPGPAITIVATSRSGGAFDFYGKLPGDNYTVYVDTNLGTVVMQFAEADSTAHMGALTGPQGLRTDLPTGLPHARVVIKCKLSSSGNLKDLQVLEPGPAAMTAKLMASLPSWKFRPATRGAQPVEVNAILGFNIDTNDRY